MGRHVRGQARHIRKNKTRNLWTKFTAGAVTGIFLIGIPTGLADAAKKATGQAEPSITVARYVFSGENPVTDDELQQLLDKHKRKNATIHQLEEQAQEVQKHLRGKGYFVAMVYLPPQDFTKGLVEMRIVPGHYDNVIVKNETYVQEEALRREIGIRKGDVVKHRNLERGVWLTGDLQRVEAKTQLKAGSKPGTTDLLVQVKPKGNRIWGYVGFDNGGYRYTGKYQYSAFVNYASPFRQGDLFSIGSVLANHGSDTWSGSISYVTPVSHRGNKLGISYGKSRYALADRFAPMGLTGKADTTSIWWQHNFKRSRNINWYATARFDWKKLRSESSSFAVLDNPKEAKNWSIMLHGDQLDTFASGGKNTWALTYTNGRLFLENDLQRQLDAIEAPGLRNGTHTDGHFDKYHLSLTRLQRVNDRVALWLSYERQWAGKNLDGSEKFTLGGPYGVRAYPQGEASGDDGWRWTTELRWNLPSRENNPNTWQLIAFVDGGHVDAYHDGNSRTASRGNGRSLYGAGLGVNWSHEDNWAARLHYAWKLGSENAESDDDCNGRLWFQLYKFF
ncbi:MAG: ShlB/FhaC/HecB family hemolysin secretion/activation protein [Selenomonas sp.]|uniref:ShlB/FhaC/HecB family hemolysin secretion/activation protein n=1 Tax=Selenomonas sp. TaxID=2053611 RepID=UPI0025F70846|nr:ShlB/FhaC/HecB family hemolysin secretion/activation protein [Selenomonas sp.]MCR5757445.1 ShlB/FhaC/HecB family hemolysin secretion/activation protein [Selenomonas sp.]